MPRFESICDGVVTIRASTIADCPVLVAGRDEEWTRYLGPSDDQPNPFACIAVDGVVVGWVDYDSPRAWLVAGEVNCGYNVFPEARGRGYTSRAVKLLIHHLAFAERQATFLIDPDNAASIRVAQHIGATEGAPVDGERFFRSATPPLRYTDGSVTIRPRVVDDLDVDLEAKDDEQQEWLWSADDRAHWAGMSSTEQRDHAGRHLQWCHDSFGRGPKWTFSVDVGEARGVGYIDCDLANDKVAHGEANVSYAMHPDHRGRGHTTAAVRLMLEFLRDHTMAPRAVLVVEPANVASVHVARSAAATPIDFVVVGGVRFDRYELPIER